MIIKNNRFAAKFLMILIDIGMIFLATLFFVLNEVHTLVAFGYYFLALFCIICLGFFGYLLYIFLDKKYYQVEETKIVLYKQNTPIMEFEFEQMTHVAYIKIWYIFLFEFEAGHLFFNYNLI